MLDFRGHPFRKESKAVRQRNKKSMLCIIMGPATRTTSDEMKAGAFCVCVLFAFLRFARLFYLLATQCSSSLHVLFLILCVYIFLCACLLYSPAAPLYIICSDVLDCTSDRENLDWIRLDSIRLRKSNRIESNRVG